MEKKSIIGPVVSVFVMVLVIAILAGLTFLFISQLKTNVITSVGLDSVTVVNESGFINSSGYQLNPDLLNPQSYSIVRAINGSSGAIIATTNYSLGTTGLVKNSSTAAYVWRNVNFTYTVSYNERTAYDSVNKTEAAGATVIGYLSLIFLAVIFGAILTLVLRIILPYIDLGKRMGGF